MNADQSGSPRIRQNNPCLIRGQPFQPAFIRVPLRADFAPQRYYFVESFFLASNARASSALIRPSPSVSISLKVSSLPSHSLRDTSPSPLPSIFVNHAGTERRLGSFTACIPWPKKKNGLRPNVKPWPVVTCKVRGRSVWAMPSPLLHNGSIRDHAERSSRIDNLP